MSGQFHLRSVTDQVSHIFQIRLSRFHGFEGHTIKRSAGSINNELLKCCLGGASNSCYIKLSLYIRIRSRSDPLYPYRELSLSEDRQHPYR